MRLQLKAAWYDLKDLVPMKVGNEFINIQRAWNDQDSGLTPITSPLFGGDLIDNSPGSGLIVMTPNGLHTYRIAVDNLGQLTTQQIT